MLKSFIYSITLLLIFVSCAPRTNSQETHELSLKNGLPHCGHELYRLETTRCVSELSIYNDVGLEDLKLISQQQTLSYNATYENVYYEVMRLVRASDWHLREHNRAMGVVVADNTVGFCQRRKSSLDYLQDNCNEFFQDVIITVVKDSDSRTTVNFQIATNRNKITYEQETARFTKMLSDNLNSLFVQS